MKPFYYLLVFSLVVPLWVEAQTQPDEKSSFTLEEAISYALANQVTVKNARIDAEIAESKVRETTGIGLPQIDGSVALQHNPKLPRFYSKYTEGQPSIIDLSSIPGIKSGDVVAFQNVFQLPSNGTAGVTINQLLFSSTYLVGLKAAGTYKDLAYKTEEQTQIQVVELVTKAYYAVLVNNERIALYDNNIARVDTLLRNTTAQNKNGFTEAIDVDRIQVNLNNLKTDRLKFINSQNVSLALLKFQMNYPMEKELTVVGALEDLKVNEDLFNEYQEGWDYKNRIEFKVLDTQRKLQELDIKNKYSTSLPKLSGYLNMGYGTQSPTIGGLFKTESKFSGTSEYGPDKWYPYTAFGLTLNVPLFSGLQRTYQIQQSKLALLKIQNNYNSLKLSIDLSIEQNTLLYKNSVETLKAQQENMTLAQKVARVTKIKYEQGVGSNLEVTDAENSLKQAQNNYYNALFDAIIAKIDLDKAYAKIDPSKYMTTQPAK